MIGPRDVGKWGRVYTSQGDVVAEGRIISHSLVPSVCIEQPDGSRVHWRHDMGEAIDAPVGNRCGLPDCADPTCNPAGNVGRNPSRQHPHV